MRAIDVITLSLQSFNNRRSRIFLTTLGVAVGIAVITFLVSVGYGLQRAILDRITTSEALLTLDVTSPDATIRLDDAAIGAFQDLPSVADVSPRATTLAEMSIDNLNSETTAYFVSPEYFRLGGFESLHGTLFDEEERNNGVVITETVSYLLGYEPADIIGKNVTFRFALPFDALVSSEVENSGPALYEQPLEVTGILASGEQTSEIYVELGRLDALSFPEYDLVKVQVDEQRNLETVRQALTDNGYVVSALSDLAKQADRVFRVLQIVLSIFGIFSLVVAAIGLLNTMTISLLERTNEIGIMRALGATRGDIRALFLIESGFIGLAGGVIGLVLGVLVGILFNLGLNILARVLGGQMVNVIFTPFWFIAVVLVLSLLVGIMSGFFPARKAARLNTLEALRYK